MSYRDLFPLDKQKQIIATGSSREVLCALPVFLLIWVNVQIIRVLGAGVLFLFDPVAAKDVLVHYDCDYTDHKKWLKEQQRTDAPPGRIRAA